MSGGIVGGSGVVLTRQEISPTANQTTTSTTMTNITNGSITLPNRAGGGAGVASNC